MREKRKSKSVTHKCFRFVITVGVLAVVGIPLRGLGTLIAKASDTPINSTSFPDANFRKYVTVWIDEDGNGILSDTEKNAVKSISVTAKRISSMVGVECFKNLQRLDCSSNQLSSLDVSRNAMLKDLDCHNNNLNSLNVSNTALTELSCGDNQLSNIDVSQNTMLKYLDCESNQLCSLDVSQNTALEYLECTCNQLSSLDVSRNTMLTYLYCYANKLSSLDVSQNAALIFLSCSSNRLNNLDVSRNTALTELYCDRNRFANGMSFFDTAGLNGFELSRASNWTNATISGTVVTAVDASSPVTYTYNCGNNHSETFTFTPTLATYTVNFNANGGSCSTTSKSVTYGNTYGTLPTPTRTGYSFTGWYTSAGGESQVTSNTLVNLTSNQILYAHWVANTCTVTFNANGGSCSIASKSVTYGSTYGTLPIPTRTGYSFAGWYTLASGGSRVMSSTTVSFTSIDTLYAHWTADTYIVTFNADGGSCSIFNKNVTYGSGYGALPTPTRTGYSFSGWYTSASGGSQVTSSTTVNKDYDHTLYAHWTQDEPSSYAVNFNANGGSCSTSSKSVTYGSTYGTLPIPTRTGYSFSGWYTAASGGNKVTSSTTVDITNNQTLYAHWRTNTYTISFNANGGSCGTENKSVTYGSTYGTLPTPNRKGYTFSGWYTELSGGRQVTSSTTMLTAVNNMLFAHWIKNEEPQTSPETNPGTNPQSEQPETTGGGQQVQKPLKPAVTEKKDVKLKTSAKQNNKKRIEKENISLESATGVTKADQYMVLGKTKVSKKKLVLKLKTSGVKIKTYKSSNKKVATVSKKGVVKLKKIGMTTITVTATVTATGKKISKKYTLMVNPDKTILESAQSKATGKITIKWKQNSSGDGYEIYRSLSRNFKDVNDRTYKIPDSKKTVATLEDLIPGAKYYVKVRNYKLVSGKPYYGAWSKVKTVKVR